MTDIFPYFWLALVAFMAGFQLVWVIRDLKAGNTKLSWMSARLTREDDPFEFRMAIVMKFVGIVVACFMFAFGLQMLKW